MKKKIYEEISPWLETKIARKVDLDTLALHVHLALRGHDGFDIVGLGQGAHVHIIVHHQQLALQVGAAEPIVLHLLDAGGVHAVRKFTRESARGWKPKSPERRTSF